MPKHLLSTLAFLLLLPGVQYSQASSLCFDRNDHAASSGCNDSPCVVPGGCIAFVDGGSGSGIGPIGEASVKIAEARPRTGPGFAPVFTASGRGVLALHNIASEPKTYLSSSKFLGATPMFDGWAWLGFASTAALPRRQQ